MVPFTQRITQEQMQGPPFEFPFPKALLGVPHYYIHVMNVDNHNVNIHSSWSVSGS